MLESIERLGVQAAAVAIAGPPAALTLLTSEPRDGKSQRPELPGAPRPPRKRRALLGMLLPHVHHYRWVGEEQFGDHSLYACRCGKVRHGL